MNSLFTQTYEIIIRALISILVLFILTKLMGRKQISQLTFFDYCIGISIGSIAATHALDIEVNFLHPLVAMIVYALISIFIAFMSRKFMTFRRIFTGTSTIIMDSGKIYYDNLRKANIDINDFMTECRNLGYFNLDDIKCAIMETNGKISIMPKAAKKPATPEDLNLSVKDDWLITNLIIDGKVLKENLSAVGKTEDWLLHMVKAHGLNDFSNVLLAGVDKDNNFSIYDYTKQPTHKSIFE